MKENRYSLSIISKKHYLCNMFHLDVNRFIEEKSLFSQKDKILVALSGGADSVALLRVLLALGYTCEAAHCNFHLRGKESDRDENFVRGLCNELNILLHVVHFDTQTYATKHRISIEMAAREMRYEWFEKLRQECDASVIAVAHHRDDSVETFLLNLIRGTGINGLKGIAPLNGHIVRPLLNVNRQDILQYLEHLHQDYVTDSTNLQDEYMRNKIRLNILPMLGELNPSVSESIAETANRLAETSLVYNKEMAEAKNRVIKRNGNNLKATKDQQISQFAESGLGRITVNAGKSRSLGAEASLRAQLTDQFSLNGNYGYTYATFTDYVISETENYNGNYVPFVPKHTFNAGAQYVFGLRNGAIFDNITVNANYKAAGRIYWTEQNNASQALYGTLNGRVSFNKGNGQLAFWINNALNTDYQAFYFETMNRGFAQKGRPLQVGVDIRCRF